MNVYNNWCTGFTAHNMTVYAHRLTAVRATKNRSRACALGAVFLRHIWGGGRCCATPYYPPQTSYTVVALNDIYANSFV
jgi:hypothetical protein